MLLDMRNHGRSGGGWAPPHDLAATAADFGRTFAALGASPRVLVGHSLGGKATLAYAAAQAQERASGTGDEGALRQAWVLDAVPGKASALAGDAVKVLSTLRKVPGPFPTRESAVVELEGAGVGAETGRWLSGSLEAVPADEWAAGGGAEPAKDGARARPPPLRWCIDVEGAGQMLDSYFDTDYWPLLEGTGTGVDFHVVQAELCADRWSPEDVARLVAAPHATHHLLRGAGHNFHVDKPAELVSLMAAPLAHALFGED